ncbi:hypothetical protein C7U92_09615 [Bradyrhizobium sp. WBOS7]|uniref:Haloacid dehalogenase-like hydrolase n=1 Tax=Bradyrhizobium betae TaxID=244734 RepID=A0AAE9NCQ6_9BRAD|nr:hypothetical protein [Bradyrhizobium sp. WBOS2]MDD1570370.1 hypothetical protein [Bradyrhizobium sp. WBOS1]MDD1576990.1 hypothetical protein [Bradyrhizobium sp. WBOS7]MDD1599301.1 hypothetical protein [Bradyrhizobium sp. WBOS16]UUO36501.1 hypothetical protein DCK84_19330 [Bradyrhizobium sp. WBOS01]UUO42805.1 hypothetical protein DCM75_20085 [Bradyrhizobium sp. WBOS02]UUO54241.1 hypothetical protein DCM79_15425 [Bradyrhizobium sp. WBOS07]UUO68246.1 hypothetical protein DCM83_25535 [Bradyrh
MSGVRIGIDFDNTIICYDKVFAAAARQRGLVPEGWVGLKTEVRDFLRSRAGGELAWQGLQGFVYGKGIVGAEIYPGVREFLSSCRRAGASVFIVSHKTQFGHQDPDRVDLREAARGWLKAAGLVDTADTALAAGNVYFEDTLAAKVERLASLKLDIFIDDLVDVFEQPHFPKATRSILFTQSRPPHPAHCEPIASWADISRGVFAP